MFAPDDETSRALEQLPRALEHRSTSNGKRQRITTEKNTDILPPLTQESPKAKVAWRQMAQLRKENRYLRASLEEQRAEMIKVQREYAQLRSELDHAIAIVHEGHQQDLTYNQTQLQELMDERNQLSETIQVVTERYQALLKLFQDRIQEEIEHLPSLLITPTHYYSIFIGYSHPDQAFAKRLHTDLQNKGLRCWFAPSNLRPGTPIVRCIEEAIHQQEKFLLILSHHAIMSNWVQQEIEAALYKEATTGQEILFPIRLDNTVLESETLWAQRLRTRHIGDFTNWQNETAYQQAFTTLLRHLKVSKH